VNTVTTSAIMGKMTEMSQRKQTVTPHVKCAARLKLS